MTILAATWKRHKAPKIAFTSEFADELDLLLLYSSSDGELLREQLAEDEIVSIISAGSIESLYGEDGMTPVWLYASNPLYINQFGFFCEFVAANPATFPEPVIGFVTWEVAFGLAGTEPAADEHCGNMGAEVPRRTADLLAHRLGHPDTGAKRHRRGRDDPLHQFAGDGAPP